jgi:hypothetical protein
MGPCAKNIKIYTVAASGLTKKIDGGGKIRKKSAYRANVKEGKHYHKYREGKGAWTFS